jgi:rhodanese-related sulfurtransferase
MRAVHPHRSAGFRVKGGTLVTVVCRRGQRVNRGSGAGRFAAGDSSTVSLVFRPDSDVSGRRASVVRGIDFAWRANGFKMKSAHLTTPGMQSTVHSNTATPATPKAE